MTEHTPFVDYYSVLRVSPNCSARVMESAYHFLAKKYHPDHADTPDVAKLTEVIDAYKALNDPQKRAEYDLRYASTTGFVFSTDEEEADQEESALSDAEAHARILQFLYKRRREQAQDAGVERYYVQDMLRCSDELFEFHLWYLKEKGFLKSTEQGLLAITIEGVDHIIAMSRTAQKEKLLLSQSHEARARQAD